MLDVRLKQLLPQIFSYLSDDDFESLSQVDKFLNHQSNEKYQAKIDRYFPYLKATKPQAYLANAVLIYNQEKKRFLKAFYKFPDAYARRNNLLLSDPECLTLLFYALEGNIEALDATLLPEERQVFFIIALSNGHHNVLTRPELINEGVAQALTFAAANGYLEAVKTILRHRKDVIPRESKCNAIEQAIKGDHLEVLETLVRDSGIVLEHSAKPAEFLLYAAQRSRFKCARYLLNSLNINVRDNELFSLAVRDSHRNRDYEMVDLLVSKGARMNRHAPVLGKVLVDAACLVDRGVGPITGLTLLATAASFFVSPLGFLAHSITLGTGVVANGIQANRYITAYRKYANKTLPQAKNISEDSRQAFLQGRKAAESTVENLKCWTPLRAVAFKDPEAYKAGYVSKIKGDKELAIRVLRKP